MVEIIKPYLRKFEKEKIVKRNEIGLGLEKGLGSIQVGGSLLHAILVLFQLIKNPT